MTLRSFLVAAGLLLAVPACASAQHDESTEGSNSAHDEYSAVVLQGSLGKGQTITLSYVPADEPGNSNAAVPFIGTTLSEKVSTISVTGDFPGEPNVQVLDGAGNVVASAKGVKSANGVHATVEIPTEADAREVLVKDDIWVRPMPFTLAAQ